MMRKISVKYFFFLFIWISFTTFHNQFEILSNIKFESLSLASIVAFGIWNFRNSILNSKENLAVIFFFLCLSTFPLISSIANHDFLSVFFDKEYRSLIQTSLASIFLFLFLKNEESISINQFKKIFMFSILFLSIYFFYRYLVLHEVRDFDLRPKLNIRHGDPNFLSTIFGFGLPFFINSFKNEKNKTSKIIYFFSGLIVFLALIAAQSRMGILAFILGTIFYYFPNIKKLSTQSKVIIFAIFLLSATVFLHYSERFQNFNDKSNSDRILTYINGYKIIQERPFFGIGMHQAQSMYYKNAEYPHFQSEFKPLDIHNTYLKAFSELGFFFFVILISFIYYTLKTIKERYLISSLLILILNSLTIGIIYKDFYYFSIIIALGLSFRPKEEIFV